MLSISKLTTEQVASECVTDNPQPRFSFCLESDRQDVVLHSAVISVNGWTQKTEKQTGIVYQGEALQPFTAYTVTVTASDNYGQSAERSMVFRTGRMGTAWQAKWITDTDYRFTQKKASPRPMLFRKTVTQDKPVQRAALYVTALGIYEFEINGNKVGADYFAPGFTSYKKQIQYQTYDVTGMLTGQDTLTATVAGGWAVGKFTHCLRNRIFAKRQALLCELHLHYADGTVRVVGTDESWQVSLDGPVREADFYDGEIYDASQTVSQIRFKQAGIERAGSGAELLAAYGAPVRAQEVMQPVSVIKSSKGTLLYDFGQNFAGVIRAKIKGGKGQRITFRHAEILMDGELFTEPLRSAKARAEYICRGEGTETYSPRFTYMGFRYVSVEGIDQQELELEAIALYSDLGAAGSFSCSDDDLNKLQNNIVWSAKSNFVDIPTDCPQRDERMGWTGDIALFASTASYNFDTGRFYEKWLKDLRADQNRTGGVPVTVPKVVFPSNLESVFTMAIDHWGDACILVPWAEYLARGDLSVLQDNYRAMKRYLKACKFWAGLLSVGKHRRIWKWGHHYGDWCAPGIGLWAWMRRGKWTATACFANSCAIVSKIAGLLGLENDAAYYKKLHLQTAKAYRDVFTDGKGKLKKEFQTAYVLPLYYGIFGQPEERQAAAANLAQLLRQNDYNIATGFPGTPYVLFALSDNGYAEDAFKMLLKDTCPSWLFEVKAGGTTVWERWDALRGDGTSNTGADDGTNGMVSFNHYAQGAVGDFLYRRVAGIEAVEGGYKSFRIAPVLGGGLTHAQGTVLTPYGTVSSRWTVKQDQTFAIEVQVPVNTSCKLCMPDGQCYTLGSGKHSVSCKLVPQPVGYTGNKQQKIVAYDNEQAGRVEL